MANPPLNWGILGCARIVRRALISALHTSETGTLHALSTPLRSRGRTLGVVTFLRGVSRRPFDRGDATYAEDVAARVAAAVDLAGGGSSSPSGD